MPERLDTRVRKFISLREKKEKTAREANRADREFKEYQAQLFAELEDEGITTTTVDAGAKHGKVRLQVRRTRKARVIDMDRAIEDLTDRGLAEEILKPAPRQKQLNQLIRTLQEQGEELPAGVEPTTTEYISLTFKR